AIHSNSQYLSVHSLKHALHVGSRPFFLLMLVIPSVHHSKKPVPAQEFVSKRLNPGLQFGVASNEIIQFFRLFFDPGIFYLFNFSNREFTLVHVPLRKRSSLRREQVHTAVTEDLRIEIFGMAFGFRVAGQGSLSRYDKILYPAA